jgi:hypothetical protein
MKASSVFSLLPGQPAENKTAQSYLAVSDWFYRLGVK